MYLFAAEGGAILVQGGAGTLSGCQFTGNAASALTGSGNAAGGGVALLAGGSINNCVFTNNTVSSGTQCMACADSVFGGH